MTRPMKTFLNLRLSARLGAVFGFLLLAMVVVAAVGLDGLAKVNDNAEQLSDRDVAALGTRLRGLNDHCLQGLGEGLNAVAAGDLTHEVLPVTTPVDVRSKDELGQLSATLPRCSPRRRAACRATTRCAGSSPR
jgi:hypothetical protein